MVDGTEGLKTDSAKKENSSAKQEKPAVKKEPAPTESVAKTTAKSSIFFCNLKVYWIKFFTG